MPARFDGTRGVDVFAARKRAADASISQPDMIAWLVARQPSVSASRALSVDFSPDAAHSRFVRRYRTRDGSPREADGASNRSARPIELHRGAARRASPNLCDHLVKTSRAIDSPPTVGDTPQVHRRARRKADEHQEEAGHLEPAVEDERDARAGICETRRRIGRALHARVARGVRDERTEARKKKPMVRIDAARRADDDRRKPRAAREHRAHDERRPRARDFDFSVEWNVFVWREHAAKLDAIARQERHMLGVSFELAHDGVVFHACRARDEARHVRSALHADDARLVVSSRRSPFIERVRE